MLKSVKNGKSNERHLAFCANFEKDVEIFSTEGRAASIKMSYIEKRNAVERDVNGDCVECSFSLSLDKFWLNILTEISGATEEVHLTESCIKG